MRQQRSPLAPAANLPLTGLAHNEYTVDFCWPAQRLIVELDGREDHLTRHAFESDRARDAQLTAAGWRVVRFTYRQVTQAPALVTIRLRQLLGR